MLFQIGETKFKTGFQWSKDWTWWITGKDGFRHHMLIGLDHSDDVGYELQMVTFYLLRMSFSIAWGTGKAIDIEDPTLHS